MTENKRFTINYEERTITDNNEYLFDLDDFRNKSAKEMVELLNELHEENMIFRTFIELNDFDADEILLQGKGLE